MLPRRLLLGAALFCVLVGLLGVIIALRQREARCAPTPLSPNLITFTGTGPGLPEGWSRRAGGVELRGPAVDGQGFDLDGDGRALQLLGIGNYVQTPPVTVRPGTRYCFTGFALTDSIQRSPTRARLVFQWHDAANQPLAAAATLWQPVVLWTPEAPPRDWATLQGSFVAPPGATRLTVQIEPSSDDRIYLDLMSLRQGGADFARLAAPEPPAPTVVELAPWPLGRRAAVAFTFDWETAMGGLVHSRSLDDPAFDQDYLLRAMRMRDGITTTIQIFAPLDIQATYYATGYNFLDGNQERERFLGDPIFTWATQANGWTSDRWVTTPWFADDPFSTIQRDPGWYFGDLIAPLQANGHEIQSHTFSHLHGGLAELSTWQQDLATWNEVAARKGVAPATSIAFPWSSSAGMSDQSWDLLEQAGITSVTRLSDQPQYSLWESDRDGLVVAPRCRWFPGREGRILACPDFYLTPNTAELALRQIERAVATGGMIDLWAHTEEVISPEQLTAWQRVASRTANDQRLWVAPLGTIAAWQRALSQVEIEALPPTSDGGQRVRLTNPSTRNLPGLSLSLPATTSRVLVQDEALPRFDRLNPRQAGWWPAAGLAVIDLAAGQQVEVIVYD
ncbi:MAG: polysaccharide deacetylase [Oscillochloridaceae bacterium umkhey_bin13]